MLPWAPPCIASPPLATSASRASWSTSAWRPAGWTTCTRRSSRGATAPLWRGGTRPEISKKLSPMQNRRLRFYELCSDPLVPKFLWRGTTFYWFVWTEAEHQENKRQRPMKMSSLNIWAETSCKKGWVTEGVTHHPWSMESRRHINRIFYG